jgi:hypothetical protein
MYCGASQGAGATVVLDQRYNPYAAEPESGRTSPLDNSGVNGYYNPQMSAQAGYSPNYVAGYVPDDSYQSQPVSSSCASAPVIQLPTRRGLLKMMIFGLLTMGIYNIVILCKIASEINITASRYDGKRTLPFMAMMTLAPYTLFVLMFVWNHKLCGRIGRELERRGIDYKFGAADFWLWNVLGGLIIVGPFVFTYKLMKATNLINADFNING